MNYSFDVIVVGSGHAGIEAALACSRERLKVLMLSISLDSIGFLACNPSIGGTGKSHLVVEIDALGGEMGVAADKTALQMRMLNESKGAAVQSLRAQVDKQKYHMHMKRRLERDRNITLLQAEVKDIVASGKTVSGVLTTTGQKFFAKAVVVCCGVYMDSVTITGDCVAQGGPSSFASSKHLAQSLRALKVPLRRFKTGTPARVDKNSLNLCVLQRQNGRLDIENFSALTTRSPRNIEPCYIGYTNEKTHQIIRENLHLSPRYSGLSTGVGARYCPSIEDKIVRFADKERHQFFVEPEARGTSEMYVQGLSTGLPADVQARMYESLEGFENVRIMRYAYAIEYECIDPTVLYSTLECKLCDGLFFAGQVNGTSGYEEAAAQGLMAGINAAARILKKPPFVLSRAESYIGVLIDDLVTQGCDEPYRMMTARAEYRLFLRQDNAALRIMPHAIERGFVGGRRLALFRRLLLEIEQARAVLLQRLDIDKVNEFFDLIGESRTQAPQTLEGIARRGGVEFEKFYSFFAHMFGSIQKKCVYTVFNEARYQGYLARVNKSVRQYERFESLPLSTEIDYAAFGSLSAEAVFKLNKIKPTTLGQAARISGVNPTDIDIILLNVLSRRG